MNRERFAAVLARIEAHPELWNQRQWCGTAHCFAGHAVDLYGPAPEKRSMLFGKGILVDKAAKRILGLTYEQSEWLFWLGRTLDDFRAVLALPDPDAVDWNTLSRENES